MRRCLVVDDAHVIRKVARRILMDLHFEVIEAENGQEALERCNATLPDVILLDWQMPVMGAYEFLAALSATTYSKRPFVIYCTTENDPVDISKAFAAGAGDYLIKPFNRESLEAKFVELQLAA
jgi:two-component system, chemotaxis family, chemotaxis protein CheY